MNNAQQTELFVEKILQSTRGTFEILSMYLGIRLGYYKAMSESGATTSKNSQSGQKPTSVTRGNGSNNRLSPVFYMLTTNAPTAETGDTRCQSLTKRFWWMKKA